MVSCPPSAAHQTRPCTRNLIKSALAAIGRRGTRRRSAPIRATDGAAPACQRPTDGSATSGAPASPEVEDWDHAAHHHGATPGWFAAATAASDVLPPARSAANRPAKHHGTVIPASLTRPIHLI